MHTADMTFSLIYPSSRHRRSRVSLLLAMWAVVTIVTLIPCGDETTAATLPHTSAGLSIQQQDSDCSCPSSGATHAVGKALCKSAESAQDTAYHLPLSLPLALAMTVLPLAMPIVGRGYALGETAGRSSRRLYLTTSLRLRN